MVLKHTAPAYVYILKRALAFMQTASYHFLLLYFSVWPLSLSTHACARFAYEFRLVLLRAVDSGLGKERRAHPLHVRWVG
jgi:hypothetical protein